MSLSSVLQTEKVEKNGFDEKTKRKTFVRKKNKEEYSFGAVLPNRRVNESVDYTYEKYIYYYY